MWVVIHVVVQDVRVVDSESVVISICVVINYLISVYISVVDLCRLSFWILLTCVVVYVCVVVAVCCC